VAALQADDLRSVHAHGYYPGNTVVSVAGNIHHDQVLELLEDEGWFVGEARPPRAGVARGHGNRGITRTETRDLQQVHAIIGTDTVNASDERRWGLALLGAVMGGGMSSRLFQRIREELGLCYAVSAWHSTYKAAGTFGIYVGTQPGTAMQAFEAIDSELSLVSREGLPADELEDAKGQLKGSVMLALESTVSRMNRLAGHVLNDEPYRAIDEVLRLVDGVTVEEVGTLAAEFLAPERMTAVRLGPA
jgi:predicted Zn-dependent peptidase